MTYQWDYSALLQGQAARFQGHTTLVLEKRKDRWMVVLNHSSAVGGMQQPATAQQPPKQQP
jgi:ketosteroid isomerase-like protein